MDAINRLALTFQVSFHSFQKVTENIRTGAHSARLYETVIAWQLNFKSFELEIGISLAVR